jgi:hypothetical protein
MHWFFHRENHNFPAIILSVDHHNIFHLSPHLGFASLSLSSPKNTPSPPTFPQPPLQASAQFTVTKIFKPQNESIKSAVASK